MSHKTNPFQKLIMNIMAVHREPDYEVKESVDEFDHGIEDMREIDVRVIQRKPPYNKVLLECRYTNDGKTREAIEWIDQIAGKYQSLSFNRVIAVSNTGFTKGAQKQTKARGVELLTLVEAEKNDWSGLFKLDSITVIATHMPNIKFVRMENKNTAVTFSIKEALSKIWLVNHYQKEITDFKLLAYDFTHNEEIKEKILVDCKQAESIHLEFTLPMPNWSYKVGQESQETHEIDKVTFIIYCGTEKRKVRLDTLRLGDFQSKVGRYSSGSSTTNLTIAEKKGTLSIQMDKEKT